MSWQIFSAVISYLMTGRAPLFVIGAALGGMLTVSYGPVFNVMLHLVSAWSFVLRGLFG